MGLSIAHYASRLGLKEITIIDRGPVGRGASSRNSAVVRETYAEEGMVKICQMGITLWEGLSRELGWNLLFDQKGHLALLKTEGQLESARAAVKLQNSLGVKSRLIDPDEASSIVPLLKKDKIVAAVYHRRGGSIHHDAAIWGFEKSVRRSGVEIIEGVTCERITTAGDRAVGAVTSAGEVQADRVVVAAGNNSVALYNRLGVNLPIRTLQREAMVTEAYKRFLGPVIADRSNGLLLNQTLRGEVVIDHNQEEVERFQQLQATFWFAKQVAKDVCALFPELRHVRIIRQWAGEYDLSPDRAPVLGEVDPIENLYLCAGFSGHGFMMAPAVGMLFAELLSTGRYPDLLEKFRMTRFSQQGQLEPS
jgi:heterotetrameric sarcosine oxidase beta subunit